MISNYCQKCKQKLYPDNPQSITWNKITHKYNKPECYYCERYDPQEVEIIVPVPTDQQRWQYVKSLKAEQAYLRNKINEFTDVKKKQEYY